MISFFSRILDSSMFSPHGICLLWDPELVWLHVVSDAVTAIAYLSIPGIILYVWLKRSDFKYRWLAWLFVAFIVSCGFTHVLAIYTLWVPVYGIEGLVKAATAIASILTAFTLWQMLPDLLRMPSTAQMRRANLALAGETAQRRSAEQQLQRFRDVEATEEQVRQAQKMEAIGQLTGGIAHDFNNLLTVITGSVDELGAALKDRPQLHAVVEMIDNAASRGASLTNQLLAFARKQPLSPTAVDINAMAQRTTRMLSRTLGEAIEIETVLTDGLSPALIDEGQLETALLNLALNARDAMPDGGRITIETANVELVEARPERHSEIAPGWYVMIALYDQGRGIPAEDLGKVFEPFFTTKQVGKGTGLGLSMVYGFAKQSRGHIAIESELGKGTKVCLFLPSASVTTATAVDPAETALTVLVVEDDPLVQAALATRIKQCGYRAIVSRDANHALNQMAEAQIDVLVIGSVQGAITACQLAERSAGIQPGFVVLLPSTEIAKPSGLHGLTGNRLLLVEKPYRVSEIVGLLRVVESTGASRHRARNADPSRDRAA